MRYRIDRRSLFSGILFLALFSFWSALVDQGLLRPVDLMVARAFHDRMPEFLAWFFGLVCRTGNVEFSLPIWIGVLYLVFRRKTEGSDKTLPALFLTGFFLAGGVLEHVMKRLLFQPLPFLSRDPLDLYLHPVISIKTPYSYPSGHTLRAFMLLSLVSLWLHGQKEERQKILFLGGWAAIVAVGVNAIGWHWSSDVIGSLLFVGGAHFLSRSVSRE
ncbi:MAG: phosphatase PAP2 family protein [Leptospirillum sp.]|nr:phosphatase PAP2 family protein [Nitrospiraceae bacterium]